MIVHRKATDADLEALWNRNIAGHPGDDRWQRWKQEYIGYNRNRMGRLLLSGSTESNQRSK